MCDFELVFVEYYWNFLNRYITSPLPSKTSQPEHTPSSNLDRLPQIAIVIVVEVCTESG